MELPANEFVHAAKFTGIEITEKLEISTFWQKISLMKSKNGTWDAGKRRKCLVNIFVGASFAVVQQKLLSSFLLPLYYSLTKIVYILKKNFLFKKKNKQVNVGN